MRVVVGAPTPEAPQENVPERATPEFAIETVVTEPARVVNTGVADPSSPHVPLEKDRTLQASHEYVFWLEVGEELNYSIEREPRELDLAGVPAGARLDVVLFAYPDETEIPTGAAVGTLYLLDDGTLEVAKQPTTSVKVPAVFATRRLFFPFKTLDRLGRARLRCSIYYQGLLIQSRLVSLTVTREPQRLFGALQAWVDDQDYAVTRAADRASLARVEPHVLSILMNDDPNDSHVFAFWTANGKPIPKNVRIDDGTLTPLIKSGRQALGHACWGTDDPWDPKDRAHQYKYVGGFDIARLRSDLISLARRGYRIYDVIINQLAGGTRADADALRGRMRTPGFVQISSRRGPTHVVPAAMIYDALLDPDVDLSVCGAFESGLKQPRPLWEQPCFLGHCPNIDRTVVCPSGFWGFRHNIGLPPSLATDGADGSASDGATDPADSFRLAFSGFPIVTFGTSTDPNFQRLPEHQQALELIYPGMQWLPAITDRELLLDTLGPASPQLVYLFCHGGVAGVDPWIQIGALNGPTITPAALRDRVEWIGVRPLVFMNGCETTQLDPETAMQFVSGFIENAGASGVIGTEITVFEPLACDFAEECFRQFLTRRAENGGAYRSIGEAVRCARLKLLKDGNPLGLVYIPFVVASLRLEPR